MAPLDRQWLDVGSDCDLVLASRRISRRLSGDSTPESQSTTAATQTNGIPGEGARDRLVRLVAGLSGSLGSLLLQVAGGCRLSGVQLLLYTVRLAARGIQVATPGPRRVRASEFACHPSPTPPPRPPASPSGWLLRLWRPSSRLTGPSRRPRWEEQNERSEGARAKRPKPDRTREKDPCGGMASSVGSFLVVV